MIKSTRILNKRVSTNCLIKIVVCHHQQQASEFTRKYHTNRNYLSNDVKTTRIIESFKKLCTDNEIPIQLNDKSLLSSIIQTRGLSSEGSRLNFVGRNVTALCVAD